MIPPVRRKVGQTWKSFGKGFVAWDRWKQDPARAFGNTLYNVVTSIVPIGKALHRLRTRQILPRRRPRRRRRRPGEPHLPRRAPKVPLSQIAVYITGRMGDILGKVRLDLRGTKITTPLVDPKTITYERLPHTDIPDRVPEWVNRQHRLDAEFQVRNTHAPKWPPPASPRQRTPSTTLTPTRTPTTETPVHHSATPAAPHHGDLGGSGPPRQGDLGGPLHDPATPSRHTAHQPTRTSHWATAPARLRRPCHPQRRRAIPTKGGRFGDDVQLDGNKRYVVEDQDGNLRGIFFTDEHGKIVEVHTKSGHTHAWNPELRNPRANTVYHVDDNWTFHTDAEARTTRVEGQLHYTGSDDARRMGTDQSQVGSLGKAEYEEVNQNIIDDFTAQHGRPPEPNEVLLFSDVEWNGGHLIATAMGGPGERINMVSMLESLNKAQKGSTLSTTTEG